ncbi:MAG: hypothetical protein KF760_14050 [Candidatus Eremiobacteraeota bacterium]|nr:hypothetical protein [Candidatus Eremiobacteraeota bacterium]MCW5868964.1 hypothetical protein [Candidatus Eremiobacteraeota bacterium]
MQYCKRLLLIVSLSLAAYGKVLTDKSGAFQFEVPDSFVVSSGADARSPDKKVKVSSSLFPPKKKGQKLEDIARAFMTNQRQMGKAVVDAGKLKLGGTDALAVQTEDSKHNQEISLLTLSDRGMAVVVLHFDMPIQASPQLFANLVARSFRWLAK